MTTSQSITVHCWLPELNGIALGIGGAGAVTIGSLLEPLLFSISWDLLAEMLLGIALLTFALTYCRVTVTPWEVRMLGSGIWKGHYRCSLEESAIHGQWLLPEWAAQAAFYPPCLNFTSENNWDTDIDFVEITFHGEQTLNCFRYQQLAKILVALHVMADRRCELETVPTADSLPTADA
ncbi:MAG: hypothetical protein EOO59_17810 [Hymenobacter sp.]|nr:MAG: hypothetical protein EOO59_17810 [Hymenobacter sp.]